MSVASIGECMIELSRRDDGAFIRGFGGDTLNTALYLARLHVPTAYVTALGDDRLSEEMLTGWRAEGVDTRHVLRLPGRLPGLYMIERDEKGERSFLYWRDRAPARELFERADEVMLDAIAHYDWLYLSGISLSLYGDAGRARLLDLLTRARENGGRVAFDGNYRPAGWPSAAAARAAFAQVLSQVDLALPSIDDEAKLHGDEDPDRCAQRFRRAGIAEIVIRLGQRGCIVYHGDGKHEVAPERHVEPVDTTAAGDSFNAAYLAARIAGAAPVEAARAGHRLAAIVISYPGAIIPREAMRDLKPLKATGS